MNSTQIARIIDHTILKATTTKEDVVKICKEAKEYGFFSVCINPANIELAKEELKGSDVKVCTVIGFPLGANTSAVKAFETKEAIENGADEVDMVINIGELKAGNDKAVLEDIKAVVQASEDKTVKVILETCLLSDDEIRRACNLCVEAKAEFVKTSTGFNREGANVHVVKVMKEAVQDKALIKAAGGVRTPEDMDEMIKAGASRIGTSKGISLM